ncbi:hypothetical protein D3C85_400350 [compost metagenome]
MGTFSFVETAPVKPIVPPKIDVLKFSKRAFSSFTINLPETSFSFKLSYKTVVAFAFIVQFKKAGIFIASVGFAAVFSVAGSPSVIKSSTAN